MLDIALGLAFMWAGFVLLKFGFLLLNFSFSRYNAKKFALSMESGLYVKHSMVIDPKTGLVTPQRQPSEQALRLFY